MSPPWHSTTSILAAWLVPFLAVTVPAQNDTPLQGAVLLKTDLMGVFAHPDDETGAAATLAAYALGKGSAVANVYCTRGEGGGNMVGTQAGPALGILRETELRRCLSELGVRHCFFLEQSDFAYTESLAITLEKWGHEDTLRRLVRLVRALRPEIILTMNPAPTPGQHGNHQAAGLLAIEAFDAAADPTRFPEQLRQEGLSVWQPRKLYYGGPAGTGATVDVNEPLPDGRTPGQVAGAALANHRSQGFGGFINSPWLRRPQHWTLVKSVVPFAIDEPDLRRGLPINGTTTERVFANGDEPPEAGYRMRFVPRPAVEFYERWVQAQRIGHVAQQFAADLPVVADEKNEITLEFVNPTAVDVNALVRWDGAEDWRIGSDEINLRLPAGQTNWHRIRLTPPPGRPADAELSAQAKLPGKELTAVARLHPVPRLRISRVTAAPPMDTDVDAVAWTRLPPTAIPFTNTWQGTVTNAADCEGEFRMAHDDSTLFVEVRVRDDRVVNNIAPDDIKGHWRSDSVELCLDPVAGAEHTLGCYKLGIFPFDSTGRVRGARDADARQGPVEETAPGTRLVSWKTPEGYAVRVAIPFAEIGIQPGTDHRWLGLNVLIYDGDKADALPGENINRSRLAWSPRPGIQGRPEDWGRADLE